MKMITVFDELADLAFIEIMSYLSSADALRAFTSLNDRWAGLLAERGYFHQVNLSMTYSQDFHQLLQILPLNMIKMLVIDRRASPLQLLRWPYLPRLTKLYLQGVRDYDSIFIFVLLHAATLTHHSTNDVFHFLLRRDRMESRQSYVTQPIHCVHSFKIFFFAIYLIFAHSIWASIPVISSATGR